MHPDAKTLWSLLQSGDAESTLRALKPQEPAMDMRVPAELTRAREEARAEAKLEAEISLTDDLWRRCNGLPKPGNVEHAARDIALGIAMRTFASPYREKERKALSLLRQVQGSTDPELEADVYEQLEMLFFAMKREAEGRI